MLAAFTKHLLACWRSVLSNRAFGGKATSTSHCAWLVAQGLTNEQVAQRLVISSRTVDTHLTSIYSKIEVSSRAAATRYALEHDLV